MYIASTNQQHIRVWKNACAWCHIRVINDDVREAPTFCCLCCDDAGAHATIPFCSIIFYWDHHLFFYCYCLAKQQRESFAQRRKEGCKLKSRLQYVHTYIPQLGPLRQHRWSTSWLGRAPGSAPGSPTEEMSLTSLPWLMWPLSCVSHGLAK